MVDEAPPPEARAAASWPSSCAGACSSRTTRASTRRAARRRSTRAALEWPDPPVLCTVALARRFAPLQRRRGLASLADALGIEVERDAPRAARRGDLRARVLRAVRRGCARTPRTIGEALALLARGRASARGRARGRRQAPARRAARPLRAAEGPRRLHLPRRRRAPAVRRQVGLPAHARARALHDAGDVDRPGRARRLPADASPSSARSCSRTG